MRKQQRLALLSGTPGRPKRGPTRGTCGSRTPRPRPLALKTHTSCLGFKGHPQDQEPNPHHEFSAVQAVHVVLTAAAAGISSLQQIEGVALATKVGVARLRQVPRAIHHVLTRRKADLVHVVGGRPPRGEVIQPVAPAPSGSALWAVLG